MDKFIFFFFFEVQLEKIGVQLESAFRKRFKKKSQNQEQGRS